MCSRTQAAGGPGSTAEATLFRQAQAGRRDSLNLLMARHEGLVHAVVRRYEFGDLAITEALHLGRIGLWRAILHYTPERGVAFSTYAWPCIRNEILQVMRAHVRRKELPVVSRAVLSDQILDFLIEQEAHRTRDRGPRARHSRQSGRHQLHISGGLDCSAPICQLIVRLGTIQYPPNDRSKDDPVD